MVTITQRQRRHILVVANMAAIAGILTCVISLALVSIDDFGSSLGTHNYAAGSYPAEHVAHSRTSTPTNDALLDLHLRKPLFDPQVQDPAPLPKPKLNVTLLGTIVEHNLAYGFFRTSDGAEVLAQAGELLEGAELTRVEEGTAYLLFGGETVVLLLPQQDGNTP